MAEGFVLMDGANQLSGPRAAWWVARHWPAFRDEMVAARGYLKHRIWFGFPLTIGITTWWSSEADAYRFAHLPEHARFWRWAASGETTRGGWLAMYRYERGGPLWGTGVDSMMRDLGEHVAPHEGQPPRPFPGDRSRKD